MKRKIFEQEQIARAIELRLGATSPADIDLVAVDENSQAYKERVEQILREG